MSSTSHEVELVAIESLRPHPRNYREHPPDQLAHIVASIKAHGVYRPVVIARDSTILAGHGTVLAAKIAGLAEVPVYRLDVEPESASALKVLVGDNQISQLAEVDDRALSETLKEIAGVDVSALMGTGFDQQMLVNLVYVTRSIDEIESIDKAAEWLSAGMPEFDPGEHPHSKVVINFASEDDRRSFMRAIGAPEDLQQRGIWFPLRPKRNNKSMEFVRE